MTVEELQAEVEDLKKCIWALLVLSEWNYVGRFLESSGWTCGAVKEAMGVLRKFRTRESGYKGWLPEESSDDREEE